MNVAVGLMEAPGKLPLISQKKGRGPAFIVYPLLSRSDLLRPHSGLPAG